MDENLIQDNQKDKNSHELKQVNPIGVESIQQQIQTDDLCAEDFKLNIEE